MEQLLFAMMKEGTLPIPGVLIRNYKELGLTDQEMMLVIHILGFQQEGNEFPTIFELRNRMSTEETQLISMLQKLVQKGFLVIEDVSENSGIRSEAFRVDALYFKLAQYLAEQHAAIQPAAAEPAREDVNLYTVFEQEFGRPLSPIECETLAMWQDQDHYTSELIIAALREAVISGKLYFRYIDRILFEWQKNNIRTPKQAREFSLKFRKPQPLPQTKKSEPFPFFNWLEHDSK
jgi:DNA replication protein